MGFKPEAMQTKGSIDKKALLDIIQLALNVNFNSEVKTYNTKKWKK